VEGVQALGFDALVVIGGDGTLRIAHDLAQQGVPVVGVPKTIDNDLSATEVTFGFDTALMTAMEALDKLHTTAESHDRVMVLEVMGRDAGWIALHAGMSGGGDIILIPEIPFSADQVIRDLEARTARGRSFSLVVVAEGARPADGEAFYVAGTGRDPAAPARLGGIGNWLAAQIDGRVNHEVRATVLGHLQRGGSPTARDRILGTRFGVRAVELVASGQLGHMVALRSDEVVAVPLSDAVARIKRVPPDGELVRAARSVGITFGDGRASPGPA
jgi:6-phosphofructokinase 1